MPAVEPGKIRNVAVVGHRGTGKTSLVEAMLFQAGATNRLGVVEQGTTISDWDEDEQQREMSISAALCHLEWQGRKINLIDTPGEPSFQGDAIAALHVVEGPPVTVDGDGTAAFVFKTVADPFAGRINVFRVLRGTIASDSNLANPRTHGKERVGQLLTLQGKDHEPAQEFGEGDIGAVSKLKDVMTGDVLLDADREVEVPSLDFPEPVMSFAITPKAKGDEEKVAQSLRRLSEEDPTLVLRRDPQTGEQLLSGLSQMHVEVALDRLRRRFGVEV